MKKIQKSNDDLGNPVIYVNECEKYEFETQKNDKIYLHKTDNDRIYDIIVNRSNI